jgi:oligopeptide/dipeptide ABC transporter ATP-binding protein
MIAMALSCHPALLIADEPTTALDVSIQAQIMELILKLREDMLTAVMLITHDMGVIAGMADNVLVMYAGKGVEYAPAHDIFTSPRHPYTEGLLRSIPRLDKKADTLPVIAGTVPNWYDMPAGCRFHNRCPHKMERCERENPDNYVADGAVVSCFKYA